MPWQLELDETDKDRQRDRQTDKNGQTWGGRNNKTKGNKKGGHKKKKDRREISVS